MYLLDSDYIINFLNGLDKTMKTIQQLHPHGFSTSIINVAEIQEGFLAKRGDKKMVLFEQFIKSLIVFPVDSDVANEFARIRQNLRKKRRLIDNLDILIAATCIAHNQILLTYNHKHFDRIPNLHIFQNGS